MGDPGLRVVLCVEYNGADFHGWQSQRGGHTVQDALQDALSTIAGSPIAAVCAGRTDAGVHALAQVVHFDSVLERPLTAWVRGVNALLPQAVAVRWARPVAAEFHARFSAVSRTYRYVLCNRPERPALDAGRVGWFHLPLDLPAMRAAASCFVGEHDFSAFRAVECQAKSPVKSLHEAAIERHGDYFVFEFRANAFLHHMVRNLVGTLIYVGKGKHPPEWAAHLLAGRERARAAPTFSAVGLYLAGIEYESKWQLPQNGRIIAPLVLPAR